MAIDTETEVRAEEAYMIALASENLRSLVRDGVEESDERRAYANVVRFVIEDLQRVLASLEKS